MCLLPGWDRAANLLRSGETTTFPTEGRLAIFQRPPPRRGERLRDGQTRLAVTSSEGDRSPICDLTMFTMCWLREALTPAVTRSALRGPRPPLCLHRRLLTPPHPPPIQEAGFFLLFEVCLKGKRRIVPLTSLNHFSCLTCFSRFSKIQIFWGDKSLISFFFMKPFTRRDGSKLMYFLCDE